MKAKVDKSACVGSGMCEASCPDVFKVVDGKSQVKTDPVPGEQESCVVEAVKGCPAVAISTS